MRRKSTFLAIMILLLTFVGMQNVLAQGVTKFVGPAVFEQNGEVGYGSASSYEKLEGNMLSSSTSYATADDFVVPGGESWEISSIMAMGSTYSELDLLQGFNVIFFTDASRKPADTLYYFSNIKNYFIEDGNVVVYLDETINLESGPYWVSVQAVSQYANWNYFNWSWSMLADESNGHIMEQPYKLGYSSTNVNDWAAASSWSVYNCAFSLHTSYTNDLAISMVSPTTGPNMTDSEEIGIEIYNIGTVAQSNFEVKYAINGGEEVVETITETIEPLASKRYGFTQLADLSAADIYNIDVIVALANDESLANDTAHVTIENFGLVYEIDEVADATTTACGGIFADAGGLGDPTDGLSYTTTFKPEGENTRSVLSFDFVELVIDGWWGPETYGQLNVYDGEDVNAPLLGSINGAIAEGDEADVFSATNISGALTVEYVHLNAWGTSAGWTANISCVDAAANDLAIAEIVSPVIGATGAAEDVTIAIKNYGYNSQSDVVVSYQINDETAVEETIASIAAGETIEHTFANTLDFSAQGKYNLTFELTLADDATPENNSLNQLFVNYGTVYLINADTILDDTLQVCGGVLTDEGGIGGLSGSNFELGIEYVTTLMPEDGKRTQLVLEEISLATGGIYVFDGWNDADTTPQIAYWTGSTVDPTPIYATNADGVLTVRYITPTIPLDDGFVASISCIDILANDFDIQDLMLSQKLIFEQDEIFVTADVRNIGSEINSTEAYLLVNGVSVDTISLANVAIDAVTPVEFVWIPAESGTYSVSIALSDDNNVDNNAMETATKVYIENHLAESFEAEMFPPLYWKELQGRFNNSWSKDAPHGDTVASTFNGDTLLTPRMFIEEGDVLSYYAWADEISGWGPTIPAGFLNMGWYDETTMEYHLFENQVEVTKYWTKYTIDISEAAGINRIAFFAADGALYIDMVEGPEMFFDESDVELTAFSVNDLVTSGSIVDFKVGIRNKGSQTLTAEDYSIELYRVGEDSPFHIVEGVGVELRDELTVTVPYIFADTEESEVYAALNFAADIDPTNNMSDAIAIQVIDGTLVDYEISGETTYTSSSYPIATGAKSGVNQWIIPADSLSATGDIQGLAFYKNSYYNGNSNATYMKVWMAHTDSIALTNGWIPNDNFSLVYDDTTIISGSEGLLYINLDSTFTYEGGNIAVMISTLTEETISRYFRYSPADTNLVRYATDWSNPIDMENMPAGSASANLPNVTLYFNEAATVSATIVDQDAVALEGVEVSIAYEGTELHNAISDETGTVEFGAVALNKAYDITYLLEGYEVVVQEDVLITELVTDFGTVAMSYMDMPFDLLTLVDNANHSAKLAWDGFNPAKGLVSYSVYLNDLETPIAENVSDSIYEFTNLADGMYTAGVKSVYDGGESGIATSSFYVVYAPENLELYTDAAATLATWEFEGTSDDFYGFVVSFDGVVVDTVMVDKYEFAEYSDGTHTVSVAALYSEGGLSASIEASFDNYLSPYNVNAEQTGSRELTAGWMFDGTAVDGFNIYFDNMETPVATGISETSYVFTDVTDGNHVLGISAIYGELETEVTTLFIAGFTDINSAALNELDVYPNPATDVLNVISPANSTVAIYTMSGMKIKEINTKRSISSIDVSEFESGTYVIKITSNETSSIQKIQID